MGKIIVKDAVKRKPGYLYYVDGNGNVCETLMARGGRKKKGTKKAPAKKKAVRKPAARKPAKKVTKKVTKKPVRKKR